MHRTVYAAVVHVTHNTTVFCLMNESSSTNAFSQLKYGGTPWDTGGQDPGASVEARQPPPSARIPHSDEGASIITSISISTGTSISNALLGDSIGDGDGYRVGL